MTHSPDWLYMAAPTRTFFDSSDNDISHALLSDPTLHISRCIKRTLIISRYKYHCSSPWTHYLLVLHIPRFSGALRNAEASFSFVLLRCAASARGRCAAVWMTPSIRPRLSIDRGGASERVRKAQRVVGRGAEGSRKGDRRWAPRGAGGGECGACDSGVG